jgi:hypothetical protein
VLVDVQDTLVKCVRGRTAALVAHSNDEVLNKVKAQVPYHHSHTHGEQCRTGDSWKAMEERRECHNVSHSHVSSGVRWQANAESPPHFMWAALSGARPPTLDTLAIRKQRAMVSLTLPSITYKSVSLFIALL